jgi:sugar porter (SP) family MFS transporter
LKKIVFFNAIVAALGGFLFGFDTAVISGAEQAIQEVWALNDLMHGLAVAIALYGTVLGALFGGIPSDLYGRKKTLIIIGILYFVSAVGSAIAWEVYSFMFFRFIGGLGVGASSVTAPMYISEIAPAKQRGRLVALFQFNIVLGILLAFVSNYYLKGASENDWRWMLGMEAFPALGFLVLAFYLIESPRWLILRAKKLESIKENLVSMDMDLARENLNKLRFEDIEGTIQSILESAHNKTENLFSRKYTKPLLLAFLFALFNQWSGINAIIYYAPRIFQLAGFAADSSLISTMGIGLINLIFTMLGMSIIDLFGRKKLMYIGSGGLIITLALVSYAFFTRDFEWVSWYFFAYIAFFALSQGAVIWVFISEIFPNSVRANGQAFGSFTHWIFAALITNFFPFFVNRLDGGIIFGFFTFMMILQTVFVWKMMPETKGVSLEQIQKELGIE